MRKTGKEEEKLIRRYVRTKLEEESVLRRKYRRKALLLLRREYF